MLKQFIPPTLSWECLYAPMLVQSNMCTKHLVIFIVHLCKRVKMWSLNITILMNKMLRKINTNYFHQQDYFFKTTMFTTRLIVILDYMTMVTKVVPDSLFKQLNMTCVKSCPKQLFVFSTWINKNMQSFYCHLGHMQSCYSHLQHHVIILQSFRIKF